MTAVSGVRSSGRCRRRPRRATRPRRGGPRCRWHRQDAADDAPCSGQSGLRDPARDGPSKPTSRSAGPARAATRCSPGLEHDPALADRVRNTAAQLGQDAAGSVVAPTPGLKRADAVSRRAISSHPAPGRPFRARPGGRPLRSLEQRVDLVDPCEGRRRKSDERSRRRRLRSLRPGRCAENHAGPPRGEERLVAKPRAGRSSCRAEVVEFRDVWVLGAQPRAVNRHGPVISSVSGGGQVVTNPDPRARSGAAAPVGRSCPGRSPWDGPRRRGSRSVAEHARTDHDGPEYHSASAFRLSRRR
jgi:hypothetical protein